MDQDNIVQDNIVRDLGFIAWKDPYGDFDDISGISFRKAADEESKILDNYTGNLCTKQTTSWLNDFNSIPKTDISYYDFVWNDFTISINEYERLTPSAVIKKDDIIVLKLEDLRGFNINENTILTICDLSEGKEDLTLNVYNSNLKKQLSITSVGETAAINESFLYYCNAEGIFWYNEIMCMDIKTQKKKSLYKETNKKYVLRIEKPENQNSIFIKRTSAIYQDIGIIVDNTIQWFERGFGTKKPIATSITAFDSYFTIYNKRVEYPNNWKLVDTYKRDDTYIFIFTKDVYQSVWIYEKGWRRLDKETSVCEFKFSIAASKLIVGYPNKPDTIWDIHETGLVSKKEMKGNKYILQRGTAPIPWFSVQSTETPKAVVICGYGSYGMSLKKRQQRLWLPWLKHNYMIVNICVRGGGENGDKWWDASRTALRRIVGINDFVRGVHFIQSKFGFNNKNTIIYGRSAGGFLVNAASFLLLDKIAVVYAAKPYTDVLRTTTNLKELQTIQETDEFGLAYNNPLDFYLLSKISPYENIMQTSKNPVVLLTGGLNDNQVSPAMPLKYVKRLRDFGWKNVFCRIADGEGHFTDKDKESGEAMDAALCESFLFN